MNTTPKPTPPVPTWPALQLARECVAATVNQDDSLTIEEARQHASAALAHIEQAEDQCEALRLALQDLIEQAQARSRKHDCPGFDCAICSIDFTEAEAALARAGRG